MRNICRNLIGLEKGEILGIPQQVAKDGGRLKCNVRPLPQLTGRMDHSVIDLTVVDSEEEEEGGIDGKIVIDISEDETDEEVNRGKIFVILSTNFCHSNGRFLLSCEQSETKTKQNRFLKDSTALGYCYSILFFAMVENYKQKSK